MAFLPAPMLDRRTVALSLAAAGAAALLPGGGAPARASGGAFHRVTLDRVTLTVLTDGTLQIPATMLVPDRNPERLAALGPDVLRTGVRSQTNVALIERDGRRILIDTGAGKTFMDSAGKLPDALEAAGIAPESIDLVVLTHGHPDHLWGAIDDFDGEPAFRKARYVMSEVDRAFWSNPDTVRRVPESAQGMAAGAARVLKALGDRVSAAKPGAAVAPGITFIDTAGHTPGHISVAVETGAGLLVIGGDAITHPVVSFANPDWAWGTDADPAMAATARRRLLDLLVAEKALLLGYHLPWPGLGRAERAGNAYRFVAA